ncbi:MAG: hypothetical protein JST58_19465 [Bacteroidetes bacterium]|nr:hypothetical protein [Bacteroidota bacterium]
MKLLLQSALFISLLFFFFTARAQYLINNDSAFNAGTVNSGRVWGLAFGDFYFKSHSDSLNRGVKAQYTGIPQNRNAFQYRRIYLGYDYHISLNFSTEMLLAAEDNSPAGNPPSSTMASGDLLQNGKMAPYIKYMNLRWNNIWNGTDCVIGLMPTPVSAYSEKCWTYRSLERVMTDFIGSTPTYDFGASLQGVFDPNTKNYGYFLLVGNGAKAVPENDNFKWFYAEVWGKFFDKHLQVNLYSDYERLNWTPSWHHYRNMERILINYSTAAFTIGAEGYINNLAKDNFATKKGLGVDTLNASATGVSFFVRGPIIKNKISYVVRFDAFNPNTNINNTAYSQYIGNIPGYTESSTKQTFFLASFDITLNKHVHILPNIWYTHYATKLSNLKGKINGDHDLVYRMTFFFSFGK